MKKAVCFFLVKYNLIYRNMNAKYLLQRVKVGRQIIADLWKNVRIYVLPSEKVMTFTRQFSALTGTMVKYVISCVNLNCDFEQGHKYKLKKLIVACKTANDRWSLYWSRWIQLHELSLMIYERSIICVSKLKSLCSWYYLNFSLW